MFSLVFTEGQYMSNSFEQKTCTGIILISLLLFILSIRKQKSMSKKIVCQPSCIIIIIINCKCILYYYTKWVNTDYDLFSVA